MHSNAKLVSMSLSRLYVGKQELCRRLSGDDLGKKQEWNVLESKTQTIAASSSTLLHPSLLTTLGLIETP